MFEHNGNNDTNNNNNYEENNIPPPPYPDSFVDFLSLPAFPAKESLDVYLQTYFPESYTQDEQLPPYEEVEGIPQVQEEVPVPNPIQGPPHSLSEILTHLRSPVHPFYNVASGSIHPEYPRTVLDLHLLTEPQLDRLFAHYNQVWPPTFETNLYPVSIPTWLVSGPEAGDVHVKRYWFGQFIGLGHVVDRVAQVAGPELEGMLLRVQLMVGTLPEYGVEAMLALMEREWQDALTRARGNGWK